ncbi:MAG: dual specificity protein phosphatase [Chloroflexota bacterium]
MDWITDRVSIGAIEDAMDAEAMRAEGVTGVLCLNGFPHSPRSQGFAWVNVTLIDGPGNSIEEIRRAVESLETLAAEHRVMVHCAEGLSRSALVVACYLADLHAIPLEEAVAHVKRYRTRAEIDAALLALVEGHWPSGEREG